MATFAKSSFSANNYYDMARQQRQFPQGKYILRSQKKSPDGQQYGIYLYYYWRGMHVRRSVDMYVAQKDWNQEANGGAVIALGYRAEEPNRPERKNLDEIVKFF